MRLIQQGPKDAKIVLVGEAPGGTEEQTGVPFSGGSGDVLNRMLDRVGISRRDCFITNVCHTRPPGNEFGWFFKPAQRPLLAHGLIQLKQDIEEIKPNLVIALGTQPLRFLTSKVGIDKWRGSILESKLIPGQKVIATYHPAYILRIWDYKAIAEFDLLRCKEEANSRDILLPKRNLILNPPREQVGLLVRELSSAPWLSIDIECFETDTGWRLACVGFSDKPDRAVVLPADQPWQIEAIKELCASPSRKVFQNGQFDCLVLGDNGIPVTNFDWDTMSGFHSLYPECASGEDEMSKLSGKKKQSAFKKGLAFQTSLYTKEPFYKDDGKLWKETGDIEMFWRYNALDAACTMEIKIKQEEDLKEFGTLHINEHASAVVHPLMAMTKRGIKINMELRAQLKADLEKQVVNLQNFLDHQAGGSINVKSSNQIKALLYEKLGLPVQKSRKARADGSYGDTADKDAIVYLAGKHPHPVLQTILEIRQRRDYIERYLNAQIDADGRIRCSFDITGTRSGRLSSRQSIYGSGTNLQNIPARKPEGEAVKRMFIADTGKVFVYRDFSQAEARVVAYLADCKGLIELFEDPDRDIHTENASRIFGVPVNTVTPEQRYLAKRVVHACNYGMEDSRLVQIVNEDAAATGVRIDRRQARMLIDRYFMLYPEIKETFWKGVENELRFSRTLNTPFGRKRTFFGRWDDKLLREAYSYIPQSAVGDLGTKTVIGCYRDIEPAIPGAETLLNVHDSVLMQCFDRDLELVAESMARVMEIPVTVKGRTFTIPTDCKIGRNWGNRPKKQPELNPDGLVDIQVWLKERAA